MNKLITKLMVIMAAALLLPAVPSGAAETVRVLLPWLPQSQFAGVYMAQKQGFYTERGIDVRISHADSKTIGVNELKKGKYDFILCWCLSGLMAAGNGDDIVNICQVVNRSNCILVTRKHSGINTLEDLKGKRLSTWINADAGYPVKLALASNGINMKLYDQNTTNSLFLIGGVDVCTCLTYNEYNNLYYSGLDYSDMKIFTLAEMGVDLPEDAIFCTHKTLETRRAQCRAFVTGTLLGWEYAESHRDEALKEVMNRTNEAHLRCSPAHMKYMLDAILPSIFSRDHKWKTGTLSRRQFNNCVYLMDKNGFIKRKPTYAEFYKGMGL
ncbi:MAG: ABC transporter substrate-binding protein [Abditibacteriota bacterium]|nr:ABC transporter substrate-binding protein [Abditibacteriota bacterium]